MRRDYRTPQQWVAYVKACDRKGKILKKYKREEFRVAIANAE